MSCSCKRKERSIYVAKDPAFLFYPGDWLGGTMVLTRHEKGCYIDLLMAQFNYGPLSLDQIKTVLGQDQAKWTVLQVKFKVDNSGRFFNEKLATEIEKRKAYTESRRNNLNGKSLHMEGHIKDDMVNHMENENRNEIIDYLNKKASTKFKSSSEKTKKAINARINEGYKLEDFKKVIDVKCKKWLKDPKMADFLRPETLFGNKFEGYLNEKMNGGDKENIAVDNTGSAFGGL